MLGDGKPNDQAHKKNASQLARSRKEKVETRGEEKQVQNRLGVVESTDLHGGSQTALKQVYTKPKI